MTVRWKLKYRLAGIVLVTLLALTAAFVFVALDSSSTPIKTWQALLLWTPISWIGFSAFMREWAKVPTSQQTQPADIVGLPLAGVASDERLVG